MSPPLTLFSYTAHVGDDPVPAIDHDSITAAVTAADTTTEAATAAATAVTATVTAPTTGPRNPPLVATTPSPSPIMTPAPRLLLQPPPPSASGSCYDLPADDPPHDEAHFTPTDDAPHFDALPPAERGMANDVDG